MEAPAEVFGWTPAVMRPMTLWDLVDWQERAAQILARPRPVVWVGPEK